MITPTYEVNMWDFEGNTKAVKLATLTAWYFGIGTLDNILPIVKKFLCTPRGYPEDMIIDHIRTSYEDIKEQLNIS